MPGHEQLQAVHHRTSIASGDGRQEADGTVDALVLDDARDRPNHRDVAVKGYVDPRPQERFGDALRLSFEDFRCSLPFRPRERIKRPCRIRLHDVGVRRARWRSDGCLKRGSGGGDKSAYALRGSVNIFGWLGKVRRGVAGVECDPSAQFAVNGGFTFSAMSFNIFEHLVKTAGGLRAR
ncbi:hypothetical protein [Rhizobium laguerreae]|uniref:hypothetical protein n=1 Tax=Rhizobium laguerreae TaxID=1076926 RepID=UPI001FEC1D27|nr:hypothetical protein [Rhizobium laguerreae]